MDLWIKQMQQVPYCPECKEKSQGCAADTAHPVYEGAKVAASSSALFLAAFRVCCSSMRFASSRVRC